MTDEAVTLPIEQIDLLSLAQTLRRRFGRTLDEGYLDGKTIFREALRSELRCSDGEAEELIDTLESRGYLRFPSMNDATHSRRQAGWLIEDLY